MLRTRFTLLLVVAGFSLLLFGGCGADGTPVAADPIDELNLTSEFGGYRATDESPGFDDPALTAMTEGEEVEDPVSASIEADSMSDQPHANVYAFAIRWGMLEGDSTVTAVTDWSGSVAVERGGIMVHRKLLFERGQDYIVRPRTSRALLEWVSATTVHWDGLLLTIVDPIAPTDSAWDENTVTFTSGPYTRTFAISELAELDEIVDVDELGNQVSFTANQVTLKPCGGGPLGGVWAKHPNAPRGHFRGIWMSDNGLHLGHLRGHFGTREDGSRVFFGKYISRAGRFRGLLRGGWGFAEGTDDAGWFEGHWVGRRGQGIGRLAGHWASAPKRDGDNLGNDDTSGNIVDDPSDRRKIKKGFFAGRWVKACGVIADGDDQGDGGSDEAS